MRKAMVMPIVFGCLFIAVAAAYGAVFFLIPVPMVVKIIAVIVVGAIAAAMIYVLVQRKRELEKEDSVDISKY